MKLQIPLQLTWKLSEKAQAQVNLKIGLRGSSWSCHGRGRLYRLAQKNRVFPGEDDTVEAEAHQRGITEKRNLAGKLGWARAKIGIRAERETRRRLRDFRGREEKADLNGGIYVNVSPGRRGNYLFGLCFWTFRLIHLACLLGPVGPESAQITNTHSIA